MPSYRILALTERGGIVESCITAPTREEALDAVRRQHSAPIKIEVASKKGADRQFWIGLKIQLLGGRVRQKELLAFTRELAMLLNAGVPIDRALGRLTTLQPSLTFRQTLRKVSEAVRSGHSLGAALAQAPDTFRPFYCGLVSAGEAGGSLPKTLIDIAEIIRARQELSDKLTASLTYPLVVLLMIIVSFAVLLGWVVPEFRPLLESQEQIPASARFVLLVSGLVIEWGWAIAIGVVLGIVAMAQTAATTRGRSAIDSALLRLPRFKQIVVGLEAGRFCQSLGTLLCNGVTIAVAVGLSRDAIGNRAFSQALSGIEAGLAHGNQLSQTLRRTGVMPPLTMEMIEVGEESGHLAEMLHMAADASQSGSQKSLQSLVALIVPITTILLGAMVASVIYIIMTAILGTYDVLI